MSSSPDHEDWSVQFVHMWALPRPTLMIQTIQILELIENINHNRNQVDGLTFDMISEHMEWIEQIDAIFGMTNIDGHAPN